MNPNRATPHTVEERIGYRRAFREFANFASGITTGNVRHPATSIRAVTPELCEEFSAYLKTTTGKQPEFATNSTLRQVLEILKGA